MRSGIEGSLVGLVFWAAAIFVVYLHRRRPAPWMTLSSARGFIYACYVGLIACPIVAVAGYFNEGP